MNEIDETATTAGPTAHTVFGLALMKEIDVTLDKGDKTGSVCNVGPYGARIDDK